MCELKTYLVTYSLTFTNDEEIEAESREEAEKKFWALEQEQGELDALGGSDSGYKIESIEEVGEAGAKQCTDGNCECGVTREQLRKEFDKAEY